MANIALVDDDKNILASVTLLLEQEGYHVRAFADGVLRVMTDIGWLLLALASTNSKPLQEGLAVKMIR